MRTTGIQSHFGAKTLVLLSVFMASVFLSNNAAAQDPQYSQFYAAPLALNPALTGADQEGRAGINYRSQWPAIEQANFVTFAAFIDVYLAEKQSGVGFLITRDREGFAGLTNTNLQLSYAYQLPVTERFTFRAGVNAGYAFRDLSFAALTFGNQYDPGTGTFNQTIPGEPDLLAGQNMFGFFDLGFGGMIYDQSMWFGASVNHVNTPVQSFFGDNNVRLPMRYSFHGGYKFHLDNQPYFNQYNRVMERSIAPTFQYKSQGEFDQLDIGMYFIFEPMLFGVWYRGLPIKSLDGQSNNESLIMMVGLSGFRNMTIGYSFDYTISGLGIGSGGAHELSIHYDFPVRNKNLPPLNVRRLPCPRI